MHEATPPVTPPTPKQRLIQIEPIARKSLLGLVVAAGLVLVGQYTGASSVASVIQRERMDAWSTRSAEHATAMTKYLDCYYNSKSVLTKQGCIEQAATGQMAAELDEVATTPAAAWNAMPAPLRWFMN